jgi:hypothetical protein
MKHRGLRNDCCKVHCRMIPMPQVVDNGHFPKLSSGTSGSNFDCVALSVSRVGTWALQLQGGIYLHQVYKLFYVFTAGIF